MPFDSNIWDSRLKWNTLIHPQMRPLIPFKTGRKSIKDKKLYKNIDSGELEFDLKANMRRIRSDLMKDIETYDNLKAKDVPIKWVAIAFIVFLIFMMVGSYIGVTYFRVSLLYILWANMLFFLL